MKTKLWMSALILASVVTTPMFATDTAALNDRVDAATRVVKEIMSAPDGGIPDSIVQHATCIGVIPGVIKGAFVFGASYGQGVVTCRTHSGWSAPVFIRLAGGSFGFQIGGQATDLVLVAVNDKGFQDLLRSKIKLGGDASIAAGPVGRNASASTDILMSAELLSYSRAKGVFAGINLSGDEVSQNTADTETFYGGHASSFNDILHGKVAVPNATARRFVSTVSHYFHTTRAK